MKTVETEAGCITLLRSAVRPSYLMVLVEDWDSATTRLTLAQARELAAALTEICDGWKPADD